jgi:hypothetical protein
MEPMVFNQRERELISKICEEHSLQVFYRPTNDEEIAFFKAEDEADLFNIKKSCYNSFDFEIKDSQTGMFTKLAPSISLCLRLSGVVEDNQEDIINLDKEEESRINPLLNIEL